MTALEKIKLIIEDGRALGWGFSHITLEITDKGKRAIVNGEVVELDDSFPEIDKKEKGLWFVPTNKVLDM